MQFNLTRINNGWVLSASAAPILQGSIFHDNLSDALSEINNASVEMEKFIKQQENLSKKEFNPEVVPAGQTK